MLKDRRVLLEQEVANQRLACGQLYLKIIKGESGEYEEKLYDRMKTELVDTIIDLAIVEQMIDEGHE